MKDLEKTLFERRQELENKKQQLIEAVNRQLAAYQGQINEIDRVLALISGETLSEDIDIIRVETE